mgnify:CR=1 FL=1
MLEIIKAVVVRELTIAMRRRADFLTVIVFFIIVVTLFPLGMNPEKETLREIAPGVVWVAALLASMLSLGRLFYYDYADGTLEQMLISSQPLGFVVLGKIVAHWLLSGLPVVLISPLLGMQFFLGEEALAVMALTLLLGTPILSLLGAIGAALTLGVRGGGVLLSLLILPLYVPILVFGSGAVVKGASTESLWVTAQMPLSLLGAGLAIALVLAPWATAASLRVSLE